MLYDISPPITPELSVFPGDTSPSREVLLDLKRGDPLTLSTWRSTVHVGSHVDAPSHYGAEAPTIEATPLERCLGPCQVIHVDIACGELIDASLVTTAIESERVLFRTATYTDPNTWVPDFAAFAPSSVDALADRGVKLVGIDTPSVDPSTSKTLDAHLRFLARDMTILEGIVLTDVPAGHYELIALPLKLVGFDASPVRAVLRG